MRFLQTHELVISTLSPVHIGTGETYEPTNYVIDDGTLYEFDIGATAKAMTAAQRNELLRVVSGRPTTEMLRHVQTLFYNLREGLIAQSRHRIPVGEGIARLYLSRIGEVAQREDDGGQVINQLEIERTFYNRVSCEPVIPGSSIKGALRTGLLNAINAGRPKASRDEKNQELQQRLFQYQAGKFQLDPLRLVQLGDASYHNTQRWPGSSVHFAVNRKKAPITDVQGRLRQSQAEQKGLYQLLECLPAMRYRAFTLRLNVQDLGDISHPDKTPHERLQFDMKQIASACNAFYRPLLTAELKLLNERGYIDSRWYTTLRDLLRGELQQKFEFGKAFLLRLGRHCGAESVTLNEVRKGSIRIMEGRDPATGRTRYSYADSAKTVWLAADGVADQGAMMPFGWVLVEVDPTVPSADLDTAMQPYTEDAQRWQEQETRREQAHEAVRRRLIEESTRAAEAIRAQEAAAAAADQRAKEAEARLAAMAPEERALEAFRAYYLEQKAKGRYQAGGDYDARRLVLFKEAIGWSDPAIRRQAASLLRETIKDWTDWPNKKERKAEFKTWLDQLESAGG